MIISQYDNLEFSKIDNEKYEVTLFINCLMGLVVIPQQVWFNNVPNIPLDREWFIKDKHITTISDNQKTLNQIVRHIRNSATHGNITPLSSDYGRTKKITHLRFKDYSDDSKTTLTFEAKIPIETLKNFSLKFADTMLEIMKAPPI